MAPSFKSTASLISAPPSMLLPDISLLSEVVVDIPDVSAQGVGRSLQRPGDQGQLAAKEDLVKGLRSLSQEVDMLQQGPQRVGPPAVQDVAKGGLRDRHILRQEVEFHLGVQKGSRQS